MNEQWSSAKGHTTKRKLSSSNDQQNDGAGTATDNKRHQASSANRQKRLSHLDYTVGWICALEVELTAAKLMLDEEHLGLPIPSHDDNCYVLGRIGHHNVAIACLPAGVYGKSSAALVAKGMVSTFTEIDAYLLVGIGGGVPSSTNDIRLGDVVIGIPTPDTSAVIQYDFGKTETEGFVLKGSLDKPRASLLTAVTSLRSSLSLMPSRINDSVIMARRKYPSSKRFGYPDTVADILWERDCEHSLQDVPCRCNSLRPAVRQARTDINPKIFYGSIGSGDQVIKDGYIRDKLARQHGILCFEMEAAGLMDQLHALVVRGICDYCDAMKNKEFQPYAALSAAAYTKELLLKIPRRLTPNRYDKIDISKDITKYRQEIMAALKFDSSDTRRANVKKAHSLTCNWLLEKQEYLDWVDSERSGSTFLWIKGKPGTGKSTIMKFLNTNLIQGKDENDIVTAFFFDARGSELQTSTLGHYRSLVFQIMSRAKDMQHLLDKINFDSCLSVNALANLFADSVNELGSRQLTCCIDALDECSEDEIREMVESFEDLARSVEDSHIRLRVVFSSRHYPNIVMADARTRYLVLEALPGHSLDIKRYIQAELKIGNDPPVEDLRRQVFTKSSGIFLWTVLVVSILNKTYARGRIHELGKRLAEMPAGLHDLFRDILIRDTENLPDLLLCLQWLLYAYRPLTCDELYSAILTPDDDTQPEVHSRNVTTEQMAALILDSSKGLVEFTQSQPPEVQFIHESVREFLLSPGVLIELHRGFEVVTEEASHQSLRDACYWQLGRTDKYIESHHLRSMSILQEERRAIICQELPLARYATDYILHHAEHAPRDSHIRFLQKFDANLWRGVHSLISISYYEMWKNASQKFDLHLSQISAFSLLESRWSITPISDQDLIEIGAWFVSNQDLRGCKAILRAYYMSTGDRQVTLDHIDPLLQVLADLTVTFWSRSAPSGCLFLLIAHWHRKRDPPALNMAIYMAICSKRPAAIKLLMAEGAVYLNEDVLTVVCQWIDKSAGYGNLSFWLRKDRLHIRHDENNYQGAPPDTELLRDTLACVKFLFDQPSLLNITDQQISTLLTNAVEWTNSVVVAALLDVFSKWPQARLSLDSALQRAVVLGKAQSAQLLLNRGALPGKTLLHSTMRLSVIQCLLRKGIDIEESDDQGNTALHLAVSRGAGHVAVLLTREGANTNAKNHLGETPLHCAAKRKRPDIVVRLLRKGAQANAADNEGNTCLHVAAYSGQTSSIKLLIHHGAAVGRKNNHGRNPLQEIFSRVQPVNSVMLLAAGELYNHGARGYLPPGKLIAGSEWVASSISMKLLEAQEGQRTCCEFAGLNPEQIYRQFCAPSASSHELQTGRIQIDSVQPLVLKRVWSQLSVFGYLI